LDEDAVRRFMEVTSFKKMSVPGQARGLTQPPLVDAIPDGATITDLPAPGSIPVRVVDLTKALLERRSVRKYAEEPLTLSEMSYLLWVTQGVVQVTSRPATLRNVPSAGARHPFETYLLVNRITGLAPGLYKYAALEHKLITIDISSGVTERFLPALAGQPETIVKNNAVTFIWAAVSERSTWRYAERAHRFMHLDAGHVCQNLYLACEAVSAGCCAIGGYHDDVLNSLLSLDGDERFVIYAAAVGKK